LSGLAILHMEQEQWSEAEEYVTRSEEQFWRLGAQLYVCWATLNKGELFRRRGTPDAALPLLNKGLQDARRMRYVLGECLALISLGQTFEALGENTLAEEQLAGAFALASSTGYNFDRARAMIHLARVRHAAGDESSHHLLAEALRIADECGFRPYAERLAHLT
jgi:tetratricopeptide (TPR) repeat protein